MHDHSPAQVVFGRDMCMPVDGMPDAEIDWEKIQQKKQLEIQ